MSDFANLENMYNCNEISWLVITFKKFFITLITATKCHTLCPTGEHF